MVIEWYEQDCNSDDDHFAWVDVDDEKVPEYEEQVLTLLSVGSKVSIKWSTTTVLQHQDAEVIFFEPSNRLHGVKYTDDDTFETVNLLQPSARRPLWKWISPPEAVQSPAPAAQSAAPTEGECAGTHAYPPQNEMTQLQKSGYQLHFGSPGQPVASIQFADSPAVAGLEGNMSDDTAVDSDMPVFVIFDSDSESE